MSATHALSSSRTSNASAAGDAIGWLVEKVRRLLNRNALLFRDSDTAEELLVARYGPVEVRQTLASWWLETCVKGEPDQARATAQRRLANYASSRRLRIARPLVQTEEAAGRWRLGIALPGMDGDLAAAIGRNGKVRPRALHAQTLAVIRVPGRPTKLAMQHAETAIRLAIAPSRWAPAGAPILRLSTLPAALSFLNRFEVAVPVAELGQGTCRADWMRQAAFGPPPGRDTATPASPATR